MRCGTDSRSDFGDNDLRSGCIDAGDISHVNPGDSK